MAENAGTIVVTVEPDLDGFRDALMAIAEEFEQRILSTLKAVQPRPAMEMSEALERLAEAQREAQEYADRIAQR